ncbi:MAG: LVIVD repeat-containing protein, partial [Rudaea sp.]
TVLSLAPIPASAQGAGVEVREAPVPPGVDVFNLNLGQTIAFSRSKNFQVVGHSYFKGPWLTPFAQAQGLGAGFNTPRVHNGIAYLAGYNSPPTLFGVLIADVSNPENMQALSFIPCNPGTRCPYVRLNTNRHILVGTQDMSAQNPNQPAGPAQAGVSFYDVSDPRNPQALGFFLTRLNGEAHGFEIDDQFVYACASTNDSKTGVTGGNQELVIINYSNPSNPTLASTLHIQGQHVGETFEPNDLLNPDGTSQKIWCHEISLHKNRLYIAWRDAGMVIVDVSDPYNPSIISQLDYVPPFNGGSLGAAHSSVPVVADPTQHPTLVVQTDEIFDCPPGFGRIIDISDLSNPQVISSYRLPHVDDNFDFDTGKFVCPPGQQSIHLPWFDYRSPSLFYQAWYDQGLRVWDISNPFLPREVGYYLSPRYAAPGRVDRHTREAYQDPDTGLIYLTDGNGGGLTVLRWTGPIPPKPPLPGAR